MFKKIYQYISLSNDRETIQKNIDRSYGNIILDLEDTVEDKEHALTILNILVDNPNINIHVRIHDKTNLDYLNKTNLNIKEIFVPKVISHNEIIYLREKYPKYNYIAMIESKISDQMLNSIISMSDGIHFGYFDYCLSENIFPIEFDRDFIYLQDTIYYYCEVKNIKFISSPVKDTKLIMSDLKGRKSFNASIVRHNQLKNLIPEYYYALDLIKKYESKDEIFVKDENDFISPHEYKLAKRLISDYHNINE